MLRNNRVIKYILKTNKSACYNFHHNQKDEKDKSDENENSGTPGLQTIRKRIGKRFAEKNLPNPLWKIIDSSLISCWQNSSDGFTVMNRSNG